MSNGPSAEQWVDIIRSARKAGPSLDNFCGMHSRFLFNISNEHADQELSPALAGAEGTLAACSRALASLITERKIDRGAIEKGLATLSAIQEALDTTEQMSGRRANKKKITQKVMSNLGEDDPSRLTPVERAVIEKEYHKRRTRLVNDSQDNSVAQMLCRDIAAILDLIDGKSPPQQPHMELR